MYIIKSPQSKIISKRYFAGLTSMDGLNHQILETPVIGYVGNARWWSVIRISLDLVALSKRIFHSCKGYQ